MASRRAATTPPAAPAHRAVTTSVVAAPSPHVATVVPTTAAAPFSDAIPAAGAPAVGAAHREELRLNTEQRRAVMTTDGPLLVVAGPGAGKTAVLAARTAHLLASGTAAPAEVLAVTFTNRAGRELRRRLAGTLGADTAAGVWAGTFHAFALRLLRR